MLLNRMIMSDCLCRGIRSVPGTGNLLTRNEARQQPRVDTFVRFFAIVVSALFLLPGLVRAQDPLPAWRDGHTKNSIIDFVGTVTNPENPEFVRKEHRIAVFDNDGTLWAEQPAYFQLLFAMDRVKALAPLHPEWSHKQPFKAVLDKDMNALAAAGEHGVVELIMATHAGLTVGQFKRIVKDWIATARHMRFHRPYTDLVYQPMLELIAYLRDNGFKIYIVSGGGIEFMRAWTEKVYGIPPEHVIGSSLKTKFEIQDGKPVIVNLPEIDFIDDKAGKPVGINKFIGRRPIAAFGNSDGDLQMLQWTTAGPGKRLGGIIHHTDADREWAYDRISKIGKLDKALDEAGTKGWIVVDMKRDWKVVFPFETE